MKPTTLRKSLNFGRKQVDKALSIIGQILRRAQSRAGKLARQIKLIARKASEFFARVFSNGIQATIQLLTLIKNFHLRLWTAWTREIASKLAFYIAGLLLVILFSVVVIGIVDYYYSVPGDVILAALEQTYQRVSFSELTIIAICLILLWGLLGMIARETLVVLSFTRIWGTSLLEYIIRLLGSLPTLLLGNAILVLSSAVGIHPQSPIAKLLFLLSALILIGLPTVLQIGQEVLKDYDKKQVHQAVALGINKVVIGKKIVLPTIKRSFNMAVTLSISRIIIEGYIVLNQIAFNLPSGTRMLRDSEDLLDIFSNVYSTMSIHSNVVLILLLFFVALLANIWSFSISTLHNKP